MQLNQAKFRLNGQCGYLLRPESMFCDEVPTSDKPKTVSIRIIAARHLGRSGRGTASPFVEVEVLGADDDTGIKLTTKTICKPVYSTLNDRSQSLFFYFFN